MPASGRAFRSSSQSPQDLIWIRDIFHDHPGLYPKIVVHGHTPVPEAEVMANRVNVDTLAWQSGKLTALAIDGADKRILTVTGEGEAILAEGGGDAVAVDGLMVVGCIGGIDAETAQHDGRQHDKGQKCCFHGRHLLLSFAASVHEAVTNALKRRIRLKVSTISRF